MGREEGRARHSRAGGRFRHLVSRNGQCEDAAQQLAEGAGPRPQMKPQTPDTAPHWPTPSRSESRGANPLCSPDEADPTRKHHHHRSSHSSRASQRLHNSKVTGHQTLLQATEDVDA